MNEQASPVKARYFATIANGKIVTLGEAYPPHELKSNQVMLTAREHRVLGKLNGDLAHLETVRDVAENVLAKIKANQSKEKSIDE